MLSLQVSKFFPDATRHVWHVRRMELRTFSKTPGLSRTHSAASTILPTKSSDVSKGVSYTSSFMNLRQKNYTGDRSGDHGGHAIGSPRPIQWPGKVAL